MVISFAHLSPLLSILFGILILVFPRLLNYLVAIYLILAGLLGIGLIGRPLRAHAEFDHRPLASASADCRPAVEVAAPATPTRSAPESRREARLSGGRSRGQAPRVASLRTGGAQ